MSIGAPSTLGTLLIQRLDAVLGTTLSQQANLVSGARPDAVSQPADADATEAGRNELVRHPREAVDRSTSQIGQGARRAAEKSEAEARFRADGDATNTSHSGGTPSAPTRLGFAARTILALLAEFPDQAPPVTGKAPLSNPEVQLPKGAITQTTTAGPVVAGHVAPTASALTDALASALKTSGLFYEAHLADLAFGKRSATALAAEPQAQLGKAVEHTAQAAQAGANQLPATMHVLVRQQLEALANQAFSWQGEAWPNTPLHWEIHRDDRAWPDRQQHGQRHWATRIRVNLPRLGIVDARLNLVDSQLLVQLSAPDCADTLESGSQILRRRLGDAGLIVEQLAIDASVPQPNAADTKMANE